MRVSSVADSQLPTKTQIRQNQKMKYFALLLLLCTLLASALALKNPECGEEFGKIGDCRALLNKWTYRRDTNECIQFNYSGCHGNKNLFDNKKQCEQTCKE